MNFLNIDSNRILIGEIICNILIQPPLLKISEVTCQTKKNLELQVESQTHEVKHLTLKKSHRNLQGAHQAGVK